MGKEKVGIKLSADGKQQRLAQGLGWFSIGLGLAQLTARGVRCPLLLSRGISNSHATLTTSEPSS
jgi:hypothetical protein